MKTVYSSQFTVHGYKGFTIVELMIAVTITVLALAAVYATFIVQQRSFTAQDQVAEADVSSMITMNLLVNDIRTAGFGYPDLENPPINGITGAININNAAGINNSDTINLIGGFRQIAILQSATTVGLNQITITYCADPPLNDPSCSDTDFNLNNRSNLSIDGITFAAITGCTLVDSKCSDGSPLTLDRSADKPIPAGRPVYLVEDVTYRIVTATGTNCNGAPAGSTCLERVKWLNDNNPDPDTITGNIDDLQIVDNIDQDGDGDTDRIRINLLMRSLSEDLNIEPSIKPYYPNLTLEDNTISENDRFRRRLWAMEVALRN